MLRPHNLFHIFGIIVILLFTIGLLNYAAQVVLSLAKEPPQINTYYEAINQTQICPKYEKKLLYYKRHYNKTVCFNKTHYYNYIPWLKESVWLAFEREEEENKEKQQAVVEEVTSEEVIVDILNNSLLEEVLIPNDNNTNRKEREKPSKVVYTILGALLLISSAYACFEAFKDKVHNSDDKKDVPAEVRKCSLAEFTINRHLRRESQANLQKQTNSDKMQLKKIMKQASLDSKSSITGLQKPPLLRRSSFPTQCLSEMPQGSDTDVRRPRQSVSVPPRSCDLSGDDSSPDMRRKTRHFIRRH